MASRTITPAGTPSRPAEVTLDGRGARPADIVRAARGLPPDRPLAPAAGPVPVPVRLSADGLARAAASYRAAEEIARRRPVYGRNTGVGANRTEDVTASDGDTHGLRLLRSHAGGVGPLVPADQVRAMLAVRANQILAGGGGLQPAFAEALARALNSGHLPQVHEIGAIGTGDLTALAETGLTLIGERPWTGGHGAPPEPITLETGDALAFCSSSALTIGQATLAWSDVTGLLRATQVVAALSLLAADGGGEPYDEQVHAGRPHPGNIAVATEMRRLLAASEPAGGHEREEPAGPPLAVPPARGSGERAPAPPPRIQDPFGFRCFPQVHGPAVEAAAELERVLGIEINAAAENPLIDAGHGTVHHHGGFHQATLGLALDHLRVALLHTAHLSAARLATLVEPAFTGLRPFLAEGPAGSSGVMILEYSANSALARLRNAAHPAALGHAVLSRGVEEHASFASQSAVQTVQAAAAYRLVLACELVSAVRALRGRGRTPDPATPAGAAYATAASRLDPRTDDRPLTADVETAAGLLDALALI
ncbi:aromatic amino acid lyase [Sphaerisporangium fuscum]|uniref:aromatic amino acid lyase n=1 Tax=Sphaerisporangium fuscum TaxID=2835868 RepID=UPI001BDBEEED|nr:aromatic amino acid lyase [Sphaerisporangium fuscum]